jgi:hypothetical protein
MQMIEEGVFSVPPATLAYDLATWGSPIADTPIATNQRS